MPNLRWRPRVLGRRYLHVSKGPTVSLAFMDLVEGQKKLDVAECDSVCTALSSASAQFEKSLTSSTEESAPLCHSRSAGDRLRELHTKIPTSDRSTGKAWEACPGVRAPGVGTKGGADPGAPRVKRRVVGVGRSLLISDGIMGRARQWAWVLRGPDDLPPSDNIQMGFQAGLPVKQLCIPRVSLRARARKPGPVREVVGSLGNSPPGV